MVPDCFSVSADCSFPRLSARDRTRDIVQNLDLVNGKIEYSAVLRFVIRVTDCNSVIYKNNFPLNLLNVQFGLRISQNHIYHTIFVQLKFSSPCKVNVHLRGMKLLIMSRIRRGMLASARGGKEIDWNCTGISPDVGVFKKKSMVPGGLRCSQAKFFNK